MQLDRYELKAGESLTKFEFWSEGKKGKILKVILFEPTTITDTYNLAFGDTDINTEDINDLIITDNGDAEKVLATVVAAVYAFTTEYPEYRVYASGSTPSRTRLYQMGINKYLDIAFSDFLLLGNYQGKWEWYEKGKNYQAFVVQRKKNKFGI